MASKYHRAQPPPKSRGLRQRETEYAQALSMQSDADVIGAASARNTLERAKNALRRQQRIHETGGRSAH